MVFTLPKGGSYESTTEGDRLLLVFKGAGPLEKPAALPRNVVSMQTGPGTATLLLTPGARVRPVRMGDRVVVDVLDAAVRVLPPRPDTAAARASARPAPARLDEAAANTPAAQALSEAKAGSATTAATLPAAPPPPGSAARTAETVMPPEPGANAAPVIPVQQEPLPESLHAALDPAPRPSATPPSPPTPASTPAPPRSLIPADASVAAASFRRAGLGLVVLDRRLDVAPPALEGATVLQGAVSTTIQVPLAPEQSLKLARIPAGWTIEVTETAPEASLETRVVPEGMARPLRPPRPRRHRAGPVDRRCPAGRHQPGRHPRSGPRQRSASARLRHCCRHGSASQPSPWPTRWTSAPSPPASCSQAPPPTRSASRTASRAAASTCRTKRRKPCRTA